MALDQPLVVVPPLELPEGLDQPSDGGEVADPQQVLFERAGEKTGTGRKRGRSNLSTHIDIKGNHEGFAAETDRPLAGLLEDLPQRGWLDETLVLWGGEFGRLPIAQTGQKPGRDHNPHGFTVWMAGGGRKRILLNRNRS